MSRSSFRSLRPVTELKGRAVLVSTSIVVSVPSPGHIHSPSVVVIPLTVVDDVEPPSVVDVDIVVDVEGQIQGVVEAGVVDVELDSTACLFLLIILGVLSSLLSSICIKTSGLNF